jgi:hypothetical protein
MRSLVIVVFIRRWAAPLPTVCWELLQLTTFIILQYRPCGSEPDKCAGASSVA